MRYVSLLLTLGVIIGCSKNNDTTPLNPVIQDSNFISKIILVDTTGIGEPKDSTFYYFEYDNSKRIKKTTASLFHVNAGMRIDRYVYDHFYTGTDTLPSRVLETFTSPEVLFTWDHFLKHDPQGKVTMDSSIKIRTFPSPSQTITVHFYKYYPDFYTDSVPGLASVDTVYQILDAQGMIIQQMHPWVAGPWQTDIIYDNHINPLHKLTVRVPYMENPVFHSYVHTKTPQRKNYLKITQTGYDASGTNVLYVSTTNFSITYKPNGYPAEIRSVSTPSSQWDKDKIIFFYTNL